MKYKKISANRKRAALLGELSVYFEEGLRALLAPEGVPSIATWLRTVRDPMVAGAFEASHSTYKALEAAGAPTADRRVVRAAQHILWELREYAASSIVGAAAEGAVGLALPPRIVPVERAPKVEADAELLAKLGDLAGWAALCDLTRRDMHRKGRELRDDVHGFALDYLEGSRSGEALHLKLCEAGADKNPRLRRAAAGLRKWLENLRSGLESKGAFKRYVEEYGKSAERQATLM